MQYENAGDLQTFAALKDLLKRRAAAFPDIQLHETGDPLTLAISCGRRRANWKLKQEETALVLYYQYMNQSPRRYKLLKDGLFDRYADVEKLSFEDLIEEMLERLTE